jgi:hypothetical protein
MSLLGSPETSGTANILCVTLQKGEELTCIAAEVSELEGVYCAARDVSFNTEIVFPPL